VSVADVRYPNDPGGSDAASSVVVTERQSGRWVRYQLRDGLVRSVESSDGRSCRYRYDRAGHLVQALRATGDVTYRVADDRVVSVVDADGVVLCVNTYDDFGRVASQVSRHGRTTRYEYGDLGVTRVTDTEGGPVNVMVHDGNGHLVAVVDGNGATMRLAYDQHGQVTDVVDRCGARTRYRHDDAGLLTERVDPDGLAHRQAPRSPGAPHHRGRPGRRPDPLPVRRRSAHAVGRRGA
jgi:YD repeat-containing protein